MYLFVGQHILEYFTLTKSRGVVMYRDSYSKKCVKSEVYCSQNNGVISNSITQAWTEQALECYELNCVCEKCSVSKGNYSFVCQMPKVINQLLKYYGKPVA